MFISPRPPSLRGLNLTSQFFYTKISYGVDPGEMREDGVSGDGENLGVERAELLETVRKRDDLCRAHERAKFSHLKK